MSRTPDRVTKVLVAPDKFKGSASAYRVAQAIARGIAMATSRPHSTYSPTVSICIKPLADGGEGSAEILCRAKSGQPIDARAVDPRGRPLLAHYCIVRKNSHCVAYIDAASASGLWLLAEGELAPRLASTYGTGLLIRDALERHATDEVCVFVGGTATIDAGLGLLQALGAVLQDDRGRSLSPNDELLHRVANIDTEPLQRFISKHPAQLRAATDVTSPLLGPRGAVALFGPQKGVTPGELPAFEASMLRVVELYERLSNKSLRDVPRLGAGGGLPAALYAFLDATIEDGFEVVAAATDFFAELQDSSWVLTGEGHLDKTSFEGKVVGRVAECAAREGCKCAVFAGIVDLPERLPESVCDVISLSSYAGSMQESIQRAEELLVEAAAEWASKRLLDC
jgi:glycerate kinase